MTTDGAEGRRLEDFLPAHKAGLYLAHNEHRDVYESAEKWIAEADELKPFEWVSDEQRAKAIATGSIWTLQWYPNTPVGFHALAAADLDVLLAAATPEREEGTQ